MSKQSKTQQGQAAQIRPAFVKNEHPNPEVKEPKKRRVLTAAWKLEFLQKFDVCLGEFERGKLALRVRQSQPSYQWKRVVKEGKLYPGCS